MLPGSPYDSAMLLAYKAALPCVFGLIVDGLSDQEHLVFVCSITVWLLKVLVTFQAQIACSAIEALTLAMRMSTSQDHSDHVFRGR